jgi:uncharacterized protein with LGFP repeats
MRNLREMIDDGPMRGSPPLARRSAAVRPMAVATGFKVDPTDPIGQKWTEVGGAAKVGEATAEVRTALGGTVRYQAFEKGAIFFSEAFGPALLSATLFAKWSKLGTKLQGDMGPPITDSTRIFAGRGGSIETATFQKGAIVARGSQAFEVHGRIYERWRALGGLGSPISDEEVAPGGAGRRSRFLSGDIYWKSSTNVAGSVGGPIRDKWEALGGATGLLGYPITDETPVIKDSRVIGRFVRFEQGVIYWSSSSGAHEVHGAILGEWENRWGGATGALGFPVSDETSTPKSGGRFNDFEQGCLVWHPSGSPFVGVYAFTRLELFVDRFQAKGRDGGIADQDLYVKADIRASTGEVLQRRYPDRGAMGTGREVDQVWLTVPKVQSTLAVDVKLEGWDSDTNIPFDDDDRLGVVQERLTIDNLWGLLDDRAVWRGDFMAVFRMRNPMPFDGSDFRRQMYWRFENFKTAELSYDQYAQTFRDVSPSGSIFFNPFNHAYYHTVFKSIAGGGNCFGMCLESVYAQVGRSAFAEPISRFGPDGGEPVMPTDKALIEEINLKHAYQTGAECIDYFLGQFALGRTHNPKDAFLRSRDMFRRGDYPVMVVTNGTFKVGGHVVRPYAWDTSNSSRWVMKIADPNVPAKNAGDLDRRCIVEVFPNDNNFCYLHGKDDMWTGSDWTGGRMYPVPYSALCREPRTPFWEVLALFALGTIIIVGEDGDSEQITDQQGRTFYEPSLGGPPTLWEHIRRDSAGRIPQMARVPVFQAGTSPELYYLGWEKERTLRHEVRGRGTGHYRWAMHSPMAAASVTSPTAAGAREVVSAARLNDAMPDIALDLPQDARAKRVTMAIAGRREMAGEAGTFELQSLAVEPGHRVTVRLAARGRAVEVENMGPATAFDLTLRTVDGTTSVTKRALALDAGQAMKIRPSDWSAQNIGRAPVRAEVLGRPQGPVVRTTDL